MLKVVISEIKGHKRFFSFAMYYLSKHNFIKRILGGKTKNTLEILD